MEDIADLVGLSLERRRAHHQSPDLPQATVPHLRRRQKAEKSLLPEQVGAVCQPASPSECRPASPSRCATLLDPEPSLCVTPVDSEAAESCAPSEFAWPDSRVPPNFRRLVRRPPAARQHIRLWRPMPESQDLACPCGRGLFQADPSRAGHVCTHCGKLKSDEEGHPVRPHSALTRLTGGIHAQVLQMHRNADQQLQSKLRAFDNRAVALRQRGASVHLPDQGVRRVLSKDHNATCLLNEFSKDAGSMWAYRTDAQAIQRSRPEGPEENPMGSAVSKTVRVAGAELTSSRGRTRRATGWSIRSARGEDSP